MASVGAAIREFLVNQAAVSALVSTRVYPEELIQNATLPAVTYSRISGTHEHKLTSGLAGLARTRIQIDCYATTPQTALAVAEAIKDCGLMTMRGTYYGVFINSVELDQGARTFVDSVDAGTSNSRFVVSQDFMVHFSETGS